MSGLVCLGLKFHVWGFSGRLSVLFMQTFRKLATLGGFACGDILQCLTNQWQWQWKFRGIKKKTAKAKQNIKEVGREDFFLELTNYYFVLWWCGRDLQFGPNVQFCFQSGIFPSIHCFSYEIQVSHITGHRMPLSWWNEFTNAIPIFICCLRCSYTMLHSHGWCQAYGRDWNWALNSSGNSAKSADSSGTSTPLWKPPVRQRQQSNNSQMNFVFVGNVSQTALQMEVIFSP